VSQVAAKKRINIRNGRVHVAAYFHEQGSVLRGDAEGFCDHFDIEVLVDSDETEEKITGLVAMARKLCFTEKALTTPVTVNVTQTNNGESRRVL